MLESLCLLALAFVALVGFNEPLISIFLQGDGDPAMAQDMLRNSQNYLAVILFGLPAFALTQCYAGTLREMGETRLPMVASVTAVITNALFNYLLIFGKLGLPRLEVVGAAVATVISRYVELGIVMAFTTGITPASRSLKALSKRSRCPWLCFARYCAWARRF